MRTAPLALMLTVVGLFGSVSVARADTSCSGLIKGAAVKGNLVVPKNASCTLDTVSITGDVLVGENAALTVQAYVEPSTIGGSVLADHCAFTLLEGTVTVGGDLQIQSCTAKSGFAGPGIKIRGNFLCQSNLGALRSMARQGRPGRPATEQQIDCGHRRQPEYDRWKSAVPTEHTRPDLSRRAGLGNRRSAGPMFAASGFRSGRHIDHPSRNNAGQASGL